MKSRRLTQMLPRAAAGGASIAIVSVALSGTGIASAAGHAARDLIDGHTVSTRPTANGILVLGRDRKLPASAIPTVSSARTAARARFAQTAATATSAKALGGKSLSAVTGSCPAGTADIGTWCLMVNPYPIAAAQEGQNNFFWASQACADIGGYLPDAAHLIGAAAKVKLESTIDDNPATATVEGSDGNGPELDQREMSATLVTTQAGSDAAGSEGVTPGAHPDPTSGQPDPTPEPADPSPSTLQYVTVYSNHTKGGFAGSEPVGTAENFRCAFDLKQSAATTSSTSSVMRVQSAVLRRSVVAGQPSAALARRAQARR
jgi:hypothetical protein